MMASQGIRVPDIEGIQNVGIVEIYVSVGDVIEVETPLISLESDKSVMDVPSPMNGIVREIKISEGDTVNSGDLILMVESQTPPSEDETGKQVASVPPSSQSPLPSIQKAAPADPVNPQPGGLLYHATPSIRGLARELGVDLSRITGTGPRGRIMRENVTRLVKSVMKSKEPPTPSETFILPPIPEGNYEIFGEIENTVLNRIKKISGPRLHRNWIGIPHITQFEDADITDLENFRLSLNQEGMKTGETKVSLLIFILKAVVQALKEFPDFNSSLNPDGASMTRKNYYNIGIAVDTPNGLVVPVMKSVDSKGIRNLTNELADLSGRAREGKLKPDEMKGGTFTISSLGGLGGTNFTPIINAPEVSILGLSRSTMKPLWNGKEFIPRLILPFSVSYDHRVIDGAQGARFVSCLASVAYDIRRILL